MEPKAVNKTCERCKYFLRRVKTDFQGLCLNLESPYSAEDMLKTEVCRGWKEKRKREE